MFHHITRRALVLAGTVTIAAGAAAPTALAEPISKDTPQECAIATASIQGFLADSIKASNAGDTDLALRDLRTAVKDMGVAADNGCSWPAKTINLNVPVTRPLAVHPEA